MADVQSDDTQFVFPKEGAAEVVKEVRILQCDETPPAAFMNLRLFKNDFVPDCETVFADLTECDFSGYLAHTLTCDDLEFGLVDGEAAIYLDQQIFTDTAVTIANSVYGAYLTFSHGIPGDEKIVGVKRFAAAPFTMDEVGDTIKVSGPIKLLCNVPPA